MGRDGHGTWDSPLPTLLSEKVRSTGNNFGPARTQSQNPNIEGMVQIASLLLPIQSA